MNEYRLINAKNDYGMPVTLAIKDGVICEESQLSNDAVTFDCGGRTVVPGLIDLHVHLREPGQTYKEDAVSASTAAMYGGFTTVLAMPNTVPAIDSLEAFQELKKRLDDIPLHVLQAAAITKERKGQEPSDIKALAAAGFPALSDDGSTPQETDVMRSIMLAAAAAGLPVIDHCECTALSKPGVMNEGAVARELGVPGQPKEAELSIVRRDIALSEETGCRIHLQHLSTAEAVEMVREAHRRGLKVSGEATPHHLLLTEDAVRIFGSNAKMAPPLRTEADRQAIIAGVADGTLQVIATDHAPHSPEEKGKGLLTAPFGIIGLEAALCICLKVLVKSGKMSLHDMIQRFTAGPSQVLGRKAPVLEPGEPADILVFDPDIPNRLDVSSFHSKSLNCPYDGLECFGKVFQVFIDGNPVLP